MTLSNEVEQREQSFLALRERLQALAMPAEGQLTLQPNGTAKADELALDFDDALTFVLGDVDKKENRWALPSEQLDALMKVDAALDEMSGPTGLWSEEALAAAPEWEDIRSLAKDALRAFGWPIEPPTKLYGRPG